MYSRHLIIAGIGTLLAFPVIAEEAVVVDGQPYATWSEYFGSQSFRENGRRCGTPTPDPSQDRFPPSDCSLTVTNPAAEYDPSASLMEITCVVHVIQPSSGSDGDLSDALIQGQIDALNRDFLASGGIGANGNDAQIRFKLATVDPQGAATTGITRTVNDGWFADTGNYWDTLAWDTNEYCNIYTLNPMGGALGYVPGFPQGGIVGNNQDRIVIWWAVFGDPAPAGPPYNRGRTLTHEVGHYLGLYHTFFEGCATGLNCYGESDLICDTNYEAVEHFGCTPSVTCSSDDPIDNYMSYTDDLCMQEFTGEQNKRMRCTLQHYRPDLFEIVTNTPTARTGWSSLKGRYRSTR